MDSQLDETTLVLGLFSRTIIGAEILRNEQNNQHWEKSSTQSCVHVFIHVYIYIYIFRLPQ